MLSYRVTGSGQPLLLIHGWGVTFDTWQNLAPPLSQRFKLIMIELLGLGNSPPANETQPYYVGCAEAIDVLRQALGIERWAVLSFSSGTRAAEAYLQRYAATVSRAAFVCPAYTAGLRWLGLKSLTGVDRRWPAATDWLLSGWRVKRLILFFAFNGRRHPRYTAEWEREIGRQRLANLKRMLTEMPDAGHAPFRLPPVPTLFVWVQDDRLPSRPRRLGPDDRLIAGIHSVPLLEPWVVSEAVIPFLSE